MSNETCFGATVHNNRFVTFRTRTLQIKILKNSLREFQDTLELLFPDVCKYSMLSGLGSVLLGVEK